MDTWMLIRLTTNGFVCFLLEVVMLVGVIKKQPTVALLGMEAKYKGVTITTCEVVWLQKIFSNLGQSVNVLVVIYCDNINNILLVNNPIYHVRTKHIEMHYHFIRRKFEQKKLTLFISILKIKLLTFSQRL